MKILVYFRTKTKSDVFEGARMRNTIKSTLELAETRYTSNLYGDYDVAHFFSPDDENKMNVALERGKPVVLFALFGENDSATRFINYRSKNGKRTTSLKIKALRMMNKSSVVVVPCLSAKQYLIEKGVTKPIEVVVPGINITRFNFSRNDEKELFYRYFREDRNKKLVLAIGEYTNNMEGLTAFINVAKKREDILFYYVGSDNNTAIMKKVESKASKNVHFTTIVHDDIYRSMLLNAQILMFPGYNWASILSFEEAMAAKCQLIVRKSAVFPKFLKNAKNAYLAEYSETLTSLCLDCLDGKIESTVEKAYEEVSSYNLKEFGKQLLEIYNNLIKE